jgi:AsmA protein
VVKILGGIVLVLIVAVVAVGFAAEGIVNRQKDKALADLSAKLGRPVTAGKIAFSLVRGRFELSDVAIGRDPGLPEEPDPAFSLGHAEVDVKLWPLIRSMGKDAAVQAIVVERLAVAVVRLPDGELNWQKVAEKMGPSEPETESKPMDPEVQAKVRAAEVEKVRIDDVSLQFIDLENKGAKVAITDLDIALDNVSLHAPFALKITAAILSQAKNFDLDAHFATAPDTAGAIAPPPLERATIKLAPTALAPLAPFLDALAKPSKAGAKAKAVAARKTDDADVGLRQMTDGLLAMDLNLQAGAAVPGGSGPTNFRGFVELAGLKFAGGEKFDARLDSDITAQVPGGTPETVEIKKFSARFGDMGIDAQGKLSDLSGAPQVDGFTVESHALDFTRLHTFYPPLDKSAGAQLRGPFSLRARGSASEGRQKLIATLDLTPASIEVPGQFRKAAGTALTVDVTVAARPNLIEVERAALTLAALTIKASATVRSQGTGPKARRSFEAAADVPPVAVRDLVAVFAPKQLADVPAVRFGATVQAKGTVGEDETIDVKVPQFSLVGGKSDLQGSLALANLKAPRLNLNARSKVLDIDDFLPPSAKSTAPAKAAPEKAKTAAPEPLQPQVQAMEGVIKLVVDRGRAAEIDYQKLNADLAIKDGRLSARTLEVDTFNGHFSGAGTELPLADPKAGFHARGEMSNLDISAVLARFAAERNFMTGRLFGKLDLSGAGTLPEQLKKTLEGKLSGRVENAELLTTSLLAPIATTLEKATGVPLVTKYVAGAKDRIAKLKDRRLEKLGGQLHFADGAMELVKPLEASTPSGPLSITGKVALGGEADMTAQLALAPAIANALVGGKARFDAPLPIALRIEGPITSPRIRPADPTALIKAFATALARSEGGRLVNEKVQQVIADPRVQKAQAQANEAKERANAEAQRAQQAAAQKATEARQEADRRAQQAKDEAARKAKEAAGRGLRGILGR